MALRSFSIFSAYVDTRKGSAADRDEIKAQGALLARAAMREAIDHTNKHLNAVVTDNPRDTEIAARVTQMQRYLAATRTVEG